MADKPAVPAKRRIVKKSESIREKADKQKSLPPKKRGVFGLTLYYISLPFRAIGRVVAKVGRLKPFRAVGKVLWPAYFRNSWKELRQVTWPGRKESWQLTGAVLIFSAIFGVLVAFVDYVLDKVFKQVLLK